VAALLFSAEMSIQYAREWSEAERVYLGDYLRSGIRGVWPGAQGRYVLLNGVTAQGQTRLVLDDEAERVKDAEGKPGYRLTDEGVRQGLVRLEWRAAVYNDRGLHGVLRRWVYRNGDMWSYAEKPFYLSLAVFLLGLFVTVPKDRARALELKHGRHLSGPELVTAAEFNTRLGRSKRLMLYLPDGVAFTNENRSWAERRFHNKESGWVRIPREREAMHFMIAGDSDAGKGAAIRQVLTQARERAEAAIVYDPAMEYLAEFYEPQRGDVLLNPLDARCPYWTPCDEVPHEAEAFSVATSLFPDANQAARKIFAHLLNLKSTPEELAHWMSRGEEIDKRVRGAEMQSVNGTHAAGQRSAALGALKAAADAFGLLPKESETERRWSTVEWSKTRKGWVFVTSKATTRERLRPLLSLWLDLLALRVINEGASTGRKTWFVLDELGSLQRLPQLTAAVMERRGAHHPVVLGVPNKAQVEAVYGPETDALLGLPATRIYLKSSERKTAEWISRTIGEREIERFRRKQGRKDYFHPKNARSLRGEITREPLVTAAQMGALDPLDGYLQHGNLIVRMRFPRRQPEEREERFVERKRAAAAPAKQASQPVPASVQPQQREVAVEAAPSRKPQEGERHPFFE
jgi:type IV secretory pathway TraG/TraD family ATPase VirD4